MIFCGGSFRAACVALACFVWAGGEAAGAATYFVATSGSDASAGTNWATAKLTIQAAIDLTVNGDTVLVSNGLYATGGRVTFGALTNRVAITNAITVSSVNGPRVTIIRGTGPMGDAAVRCVYVGTNATLAGFTLNNGATRAVGETNGGGAWCELSGVLNNCMLTRNTAAGGGGGSYQGLLNNCALVSNSARYGGGSYLGTLNNCTLARNSATNAGGGSYEGALNNCIVWTNIAPADANYFLGSGSINFSCTTPAPTNGANNITNNPLFVSLNATNIRPSAISACIDAGNNAYAPTNATPFDLAGGPRIFDGTVDMGAYEAPSVLRVIAIGGTTTGTGFHAAGSNVVISATASNSHWFFTSWNDGDTNAARTVVMPTNSITYTATFTQFVGALTLYVATNGSNAADGRSWPTAKQTIQAAIDVSLHGDTVLVSNGVYATGGRRVFGAITNRVAITNAITVSSVNGPDFTFIQGAKDPLTTNGDAAVRCVYVGTNATLAGFTLTNGATRGFAFDFFTERAGGGAWCEPSGVLSNCTLTGNSAHYYGGGSFQGTLNNCTLAGNSAANSGGGAVFSMLNNCTLAGNSAVSGGGSSGGTLNNCTLVGNSALYGGGSDGGTLNGCVLTSNSAEYGGGSVGGTLNNCTLAANVATNGGASYDGTLSDCVLTANSATNGGGAYGATLYNCTLAGNSASDGGGSYFGTLNNCMLTNNSARYGGGSAGSALNSCTLAANSAVESGGGALGGTLKRCTLTGNSAANGGGANSATLYNCILTGNSAPGGGGGALGSTLYNCTVADNSAAVVGGGIYNSAAYNCIVWSNSAPSDANYIPVFDSFFNSCTTPMPSNGTLNITNDPQFVSLAATNLRLSANSPCISMGENVYAPAGSDLDGNPRIINGTVDMGAYEFQPYSLWAAAITNGLTNYTDSATGDGYANLLKYVTGSSPTNSDELAALGATFLVVGQMVVTNEDLSVSTNDVLGDIALRFNRNTNATDASLFVEAAYAATNDTLWTPIATNRLGSWGGDTNVTETGAGTPVSVSVTVTDPNDVTNKFFRLRVTLP